LKHQQLEPKPNRSDHVFAYTENTMALSSSEKVTLNDGTVVGAFAVKKNLLRSGGMDLVIGTLEEKVDGLPFSGKG